MMIYYCFYVIVELQRKNEGGRKMEMFCYQCEQNAGGQGCQKVGVCGKSPDVAALQDLLIDQLKGIGFLGSKLFTADQRCEITDGFVQEALFTTVTNVDFDPARIQELINRAHEIKEKIKEVYIQKHGREGLPEQVNFKPAADLQALIGQAARVGIFADRGLNEDIRSLRELLTYGIKGLAAYADHARILGQSDPKVNAFFYKALASLINPSLTVQDYVGLNLECGEINIRCMELLDAGNTGHFGHPVPTSVSLGARKGKAILVSGHDLLDLEELLKQTEGKGINVYTHGEMLPAHGYPGLKKYPHLAGNYGGAWQDQAKEFDLFPGAILMTTNCIQKPKDTYKDRIFTTGLVAWPGVKHVADRKAGGTKDFSAVIEKALSTPGFPADVQGKSVMVGFARNAVLGVADKVIEAVKGGAIKHFFLIGGCDGAKSGRNYYTEFAEKTPSDTVILTLACGKYRFYDKEFGAIGGIPRLLDVGQCNDAYSAVQIAVALAGAFNCGVNDLPLSFILSWYEQKAVVILLSLLHLGIRDIRLGPSLPAFVSPNVLNVLVENFNIMPTTTAEADLAACLGGKEATA